KEQIVAPSDQENELPPLGRTFLSDRDNRVERETVRKGNPEAGARNDPQRQAAGAPPPPPAAPRGPPPPPPGRRPPDGGPPPPGGPPPSQHRSRSWPGRSAPDRWRGPSRRS